MQGQNFDIFISYRRSDGEPIARIITETLKGKNYRCFLDYDKLRGGKFDERIEKAIKDAPVFIAVMTPDYLVRPKEDGEKELSEEEKENQGEDWVYKEIEIANANNKYIISINHNKKIKSIPKEVPANIAKALGAHTFAEVYDGQKYASNMEDLIKGWISEIVPPPTEKTQGKANIEVKSDADCDILKTGEVIATIAKGGYNILKLPHGEHRLVCRSNEFSDIEQEVKLEIAKDLPDAFFDVKLEKRIKPRRKKIEREKKREERRIEREKRKAEKAKIREKQNLDNQKRREERKRYWEETLRPLFRKIGNGLAIAWAAVAIVWALVQGFRSCEGTTETATETAVETITESNTNNNDSVRKQNIDVSKFICIKTKQENCGTIWKISYSKDGKYINVVGDEYIKKLTNDLDSCISNIKLYKYGTGDISNEGLIVRNNGKILEILNNEGKCIRTLKGHSENVYSVCWSPDGKYLASGSDDETVKIWDAESGKCIKTLIGHYFSVDNVNWNHNSDKIISWVNSGNSFKVWDAKSGKCIRTVKGHSSWVWSVSWSPDGKYLASGSVDETVKIWDAKSGECIQTLAGHSSYVRSVSWSPDGKYLASGSSDDTIIIWDASSGAKLKTLEGHSECVLSVCWSPDGKYLASSSSDNTVRIWGVE